MPEQPYFAEGPLERIVDVHWKKKKPPDPVLTPPYCGSYGSGGIYGVINEHGDKGNLPFGPRLYAPIVGTYSTVSMNFVGELMVGAPNHPMPPAYTPTMTAATWGQGAIKPLLDATRLEFSIPQLYWIIEPDTGYVGVYGWNMPMVGGTNAEAVPIVIKSYTLKLAWASVDVSGSGDQFGILFQHPGGSGGQPTPEDIVIAGDATGGEFTYVYDFKYKEWASGDIHVTADNQFDPTIGGPVFLYWCRNNRPSTEWMASTLITDDNWYTWEIIAECQTMPDDINPGT